MKLAIVQSSLGKCSLAEAFSQAAESGADGLELRYATTGQLAELHKKQYPRNLKALAESSGVAVPSFCMSWVCQQPTFTGTAKAIAAAQDEIIRVLAIAHEAGVPFIGIPFFGKNIIEVEDDFQRASDAIMELVEEAEEAGVTLTVACGLNFSKMQLLLGQLGNPPGVKICFDAGSAAARKLDVAGSVRNLGRDAISLVHLRDVRIVEGEPPDYSVSLGEGDADFRALAKALLAIEYDGWVIVDVPPGENPVAHASENLTFARDLLAAAATM